MDDDLNQDDRLTIAKAMDQIESDTCVKFVPRGLNPYYVHIGRYAVNSKVKLITTKSFSSENVNVEATAVPSMEPTPI